MPDSHLEDYYENSQSGSFYDDVDWEEDDDFEDDEEIEQEHIEPEEPEWMGA